MNHDPITPAVRQQAIAWYSLTQSGEISAEQLRQLQHWRDADGEHERAWQRMLGLPDLLRNHAALLRDPAARTALQQARYVSGERRQVLKLLLGASLLGAVTWQGKESQWAQGRLADLATATGERRREVLGDGTQLWLNTATAVDIDFTREQRCIRLRHGEINVLGGQDPTGRPLLVQTADARLRPLDSRFSLRCGDGCVGTLLSVSSGQVAAAPRPDGDERIIQAGQRARIDAGKILLGPAPALDDAWIGGFVSAEATRLDDLVAQLARYRPGLLRCDPRVADLRVTGSYPLADNERILDLLESSLPVRIQRRTRYWVTLLPRNAA